MFGNNVIKIDFDSLDNAIRTYSRSIDALTKAKSDIQKGIRGLKNDWKGEAKDAYFNVKYVDWDKGLDEHIDRMQFLKKQLELVKRAYTEIDNDGQRLQNKI